MMFGTREEFSYFQCSACGCLQIETIPAEMAAYYPADYYSYSTSAVSADPPWRKWVKPLAMRGVLANREVGQLASVFRIVPGDMQPWLQSVGLRPSSRILDVGCGQGRLLRVMAKWGFSSLTGADPFVSTDLSYPDGVRVLRRSLEAVTGEFDCIMMHHSFEHMADPKGVMSQVKRLLAPHGHVLVRIPLCSSAAYREYGIDWVQLDAPRHFFLHSRKSFEILAQNAGLTVERVLYDSYSLQFWGSEQYRKGIPLRSSESYAENPNRCAFSTEQIAQFEARAKQLNAAEDGDQACFVLA